MTPASPAASLASHLAPSPHFDRPTYLMCPPVWYDVDYVINPWMAGNLHRPSRDRAFAQWRALYQELRHIAEVRVLQARPGSPDMVFVAHAALVRHGVAAIASFAHRQRQAEEHHLRTWFQEAGFLIWDTPRQTSFEGEGDALFDSSGNHLWAAHGVRTCQHCHRHIASAWHTPVTSLHLVDPRFYHLDICFAPLAGGYLLYYPAAFDAASLEKIEAAYAPNRRIPVTEQEATHFACSVINTGSHVIMSTGLPQLRSRLAGHGFEVCEVDLSEFHRGGGSAKSLALRLSDIKSSSESEV